MLMAFGRHWSIYYCRLKVCVGTITCFLCFIKVSNQVTDMACSNDWQDKTGRQAIPGEGKWERERVCAKIPTLMTGALQNGEHHALRRC